jgi:formyltetrahydrofolate-dependent phosphoribosylglycinamide formyltransferase
MSNVRVSPLRLVMLISGGGTTLANLLSKIETGLLDAQIPLVISSNPAAGGMAIAAAAGIRTAVVERRKFPSTTEFSHEIFTLCRSENPNLAVMGGWLKLVVIPDDYQHRVTNIHPALIPAFCGRGFYGHRVHEAVLEYGARISGCTVHFVDNEYDHGPIILQRTVDVLDTDSPETLAARVFAAECEAYPEALRLYAAGRLRVQGRRVRILAAT